MRVAEGKRTLSKQLTLCYCDTWVLRRPAGSGAASPHALHQLLRRHGMCLPLRGVPGGGQGGGHLGSHAVKQRHAGAERRRAPLPSTPSTPGDGTCPAACSAEEAAVARDLATLWNWQQLGVPEHSAQHRLNFQLARWAPQQREAPRALSTLCALQHRDTHATGVKGRRCNS